MMWVQQVQQVQQGAGPRGGGGGSCLMDLCFLCGMTKIFQSWVVAMVAQRCECSKSH